MKIDGKEYSFDLKKEEIKKIFNTPDYQEYKEKSKKEQKRRERIYQYTSIGNSTNSVRNLILANVIFFVLSYFLPLIKYFASYNIANPNFEIWQPLTSMFLHGGIIHILLNMFVLWQFGNQIEQVINTKKFLSLYFISGIVSGILYMFFSNINIPAVGASGAICGLMAAYVFIAPETKVLLFFFIPIKIKNMIYGFAIFSLVFGILSLINPILGFGVAHFGHLGGLVGGYLLTYYWKTRNMIPTFDY
jgi:membrane associated rhomboid family serine protease